MLLLLISLARHCTVYCFCHCNKTFLILALHVSIVHVSNSAYRPEYKKENEMNPWRMCSESEPPDFVWEWQTAHSRWCCYLLSGISCESTTRSPVTPVFNKTCTSANLRDGKTFAKWSGAKNDGSGIDMTTARTRTSEFDVTERTNKGGLKRHKTINKHSWLIIQILIYNRVSVGS